MIKRKDNPIELRQRRKYASTVLAVAISAVFLLASCSNSGQSAAKDNALAADFQIIVYQGEDVLGGSEIQFSELLAQGKPIVLNMWAGLCPPCRIEMSDLQRAYGEIRDDVLLVGLDVGPFVGLGSQKDGRALLEKSGVTYPAGTTSDSEVMRAWRLTGTPTTFFIKPNGEIVSKWIGVLTKAKLIELVEELLRASNAHK